MAGPQRPGGRVLLVGLIVIALLVGGGIADSVLGTSSGRASSSSAAAAESAVVSPAADTTVVGSGSVLAVAFSGDRETFADLMADGTVQLRDATTGAVLGTLKSEPTTSQDASLAFSPDGKTLAVGTSPVASAAAVDGVQLWNVARRTLTTTIPISGLVHAVAYSPDGSTIAVAAGQDLALVNTTTLSPLYVPAPEGSDPEDQGNALMVAYSGDGNTLAIADNEGLIQFWNVSEMRFTRSITTQAPAGPGHLGGGDSVNVNAIALNDNGTSVAAVGSFGYVQLPYGDGTAPTGYPEVWLANTTTGKQQALTPDYPSGFATRSVLGSGGLTGLGDVDAVAFSPTADLFVTGDDQGDWQLWNGATGWSVESLYSQSDEEIDAMAFSADGRTLATAQADYSSEATAKERAAASNTSIVELWHIYRQPDTGTTCAAHGSTAANPVLAYTTSTTVELRCGSGPPAALGTELPIPSAAGDIGQLAWSWDGTQLAWLSTSRISVADVATGAVRTWACVACTGLAFLGGRAVTVAQQFAGGAPTAAGPQLVEYPAAGSGDPTTLAVTGIPDSGSAQGFDTDFRLLTAVAAGTVVVAYGSAGGSDFGGDELLYRVGPNGRATGYGDATANAPSNGPGTIFGGLSDAMAASADGSLALVETGSSGRCGESNTPVVVDTATGAVSTPKLPSTGGGTGGFWVEGLWYDASGTPYVSLVPNGSYCSSTGTATTTGTGTGPIFPVSANPIVGKLVDGAWTVVGRGTFQASYGPGGWLAAQDGTISNSVEKATVKVTHGSTSYSLSGVISCAWAPLR